MDVVDGEHGGRNHDGEIIYSSYATIARGGAGPAPRRLLAHLARPHAAHRAAPGADGRGQRPRQDPPDGRLGVPLRRGWRARPRDRRPAPAAGAPPRPRPRGADEGRARPGRSRARGAHQQRGRYRDGLRRHLPGARPVQARDRPARRRGHAGRRRVVYRRPRAYSATYYARAEPPAGAVEGSLAQLGTVLGAGPRFLYFWWP